MARGPRRGGWPRPGSTLRVANAVQGGPAHLAKGVCREDAHDPMLRRARDDVNEDPLVPIAPITGPAMTAPAQGLRVRARSESGGHVLSLSGELDLASAGMLDTSIAELCTDGSKRITLEMEALEFMDSTGLRSVLVGQELCEVNGCELLIGTMSPQVRRLFEVSGVGEQLVFRGAVDEGS